MSDEAPSYFPIAANRTSWCPHCPDAIELGDAIVRRRGEQEWCHHACALEQDHIDADPEGWAAEIRFEYERRRQAEIEHSIVRGHVRARPRPRKRKQRRAHAA